MEKLNSKITNLSVSNVFNTFFNLDGKNKQYLKFIESIFLGIIPSPIIISLATTKNKKKLY